jgi:hypothetical protein
VLFTFPSQYLFTIGLSGVFSLGGWSPHIQTGFHVSRPTHLSSKYTFQIRGYHPLRLFFPEHSFKYIKTFGLIRVRSPLLTESLRFLFLRVLRCFSSPGLLSLRSDWSSTRRVAPFGHLGINSCVPIPRAFRSLPRPSSPLKA